MTILIAIISGLLAGISSGLFGIGGGIILVPILLYVFTVEIKVAAGTSLAIILPATITGAVAHFYQGNINLKLAFFIGVGAIAGALFGARMAEVLDAAIIKKGFAVLLIIVTAKVVYEAFELNRFF